MSTWIRRNSSLFFILVAVIILMNQTQGEMVTDTSALLDQAVFQARGQNETLLHIQKPGRYSIQVRSGQGTRLEVVDRMAGPFASSGIAGIEDGRVDVLLDIGAYKIRLKSHKNGTGEAKLVVYPFTEAQEAQEIRHLPFLKSLKIIEGSLEDLQQRSWWLHIKKRQILRLEIIGRNLRDCRLWREGSWLEDITPDVSQYDPIDGRPMTYLEFHHDLNPGLYLVTCYGGAPEKWAKDTGANPFYLRLGVPYLGENGQRLMTVSPFGRDVFLVGRETNFFQLVRENKKQTSLKVRYWEKTGSRFGYGESAVITKKSRDPWCSLYTNFGSDRQWVVVTGSPGDALELDYFVQRNRYRLPEDYSEYWISSIHSAAGRDAIDATAILTGNKQKTPVKSSALKIGSELPLVRRVNLLNTASVFLFVENAGTYVMTEYQDSGASADYQIKPFMVRTPRKYKPPPFFPAGSEFELTRGFHQLTIRPRSKGILQFILSKKTERVQGMEPSSDWSRSATPKALRTWQSVLWPSVILDRSSDYYTLWLNKRPGVQSGVTVRPLPLSLEDPLAVSLSPDQSASVKITAQESTRLEVTGDAHQLTVDDRAYSELRVLQPGRYTVELKNTGINTRLFNLRAIPVDFMIDPQPEIKNIESLFPVLTQGSPLFVDFARKETKYFMLRVQEPGLYRLETSGRLATQIRVRTRLTTSLFSARQNGVGRNALVQQYFKPGDYLVSVRTLGKSAGRAGIHLRQAALEEIPGLTVGDVKRNTVPTDAAILLPFRIENTGKYHLETYGLEKRFPHRLEDTDHWPLMPPGGNTTIVREFTPGSYYYYSLPVQVESRRVTFLREILDTQKLIGKGPHPLALNTPLENIWMEEQDRPPDVYTVTITAPTHVSCNVRKDLQASIHLRTGRKVAETSVGVWKGLLAKADYEIRVKSPEENNRVPYTISVTTNDLIPGLQQNVPDLPHTLNVSLGTGALVDITSFGRTDVKAFLWDEKETTLIAWNDDMENDWNFKISQTLDADWYKLKLTAAGAGKEPFLVSMEQRRKRVAGKNTIPLDIRQELGDELLKIPFSTGGSDALFHFKVKSSGTVNLAILKNDSVLAEADNEIYIPLRASTAYHLLLWRQEAASGNVQLTAKPVKTIEIVLQNKAEPLPDFTAARLRNDARISARFRSEKASLYYSSALERPCLPTGSLPEGTGQDGSGWLVSDTRCAVVIEPFGISRENPADVLLGDVPLSFNLIQDLDAPMLLEVESVNTLVAATAFPVGQPPAKPFPWAGMMTRPSKTLFGIPGKGLFQGKVWLTTDIPRIRSAKMRDNVLERVHLRMTSFPPLGQRDFRHVDVMEETIPAGRSLFLLLDDQPRQFLLTLSKGIVAYSWNNGEPNVMVAAMEESGERRMSCHGGLLTILNTGTRPALFRVEKRDHPIDDYGEIGKDGFENVFTRHGTIHFKISALDPGRKLYVTGEDITSRIWRDNGKVIDGTLRNDGLPIRVYDTGEGILKIIHGLGLVRVWSALDETTYRRFMGTAINSGIVDIQDGRVALRNQLQYWSFQLDAASFIVAETNAPGAMALFQGVSLLALDAGSTVENRRLTYYLPAGKYKLWTRPLKGLLRMGTLTLTRIVPTDLSREESDERRLIRPGEYQVFRFTVKVKGIVGAGLEADIDGLDAQLFNTDNHLVAKGPLMFKELPPGEYLLVIKARGTPVQYRPVILGAEGSRQGVPDDVIEKYMKEEDR